MSNRKLLFPRYVLHSALSIQHIGIIGAFKLLIYRYLRKEFGLRILSNGNRIRLRGCSSDLPVMYSIICHNDYYFSEIAEVDYVIDCGANIGISTLQLKSLLDPKYLVAIEPDPGNFILLQKNCQNDPSIECLKGAVWPIKQNLSIENPCAEKFAFKCIPTTDNTNQDLVNSYTMSELIEAHPGVRTLVKMDIEGAENDIFSANPEWIYKINYLIMEIHPGCWKAVFDQMKEFDYDCRFSGENILFIFNH